MKPEAQHVFSVWVVHRSTNNGVSWTIFAGTATGTPHLFDQDFDYNHEIVINPTNGDVLVANVGGIYRISSDGLTTEQEISAASGSDWTDIVVSSTGIFFAVTEGGVFKSTDGTNWGASIAPPGMNFTDGDRKELALAPSDADILYVLGEDSNAGEHVHTLWKFDDSIDAWTNLSTNLPDLDGETGDFQSQGGYDLLIKVKPDEPNFVVIGGRNLWRSTDGFATLCNTSTCPNTSWIGGYTPANATFDLYDKHHPDQHSFVFLSGTKAISGNDGGLHFTSDITDNVVAMGIHKGVVDWTPLNNGYLTTQVYALSVGPSDQVLAGFQDNGTWLTTSINGTIDWTTSLSGDGGYSAFNLDGTKRYLSSQKGAIELREYSSAISNTPIDIVTFTPNGYTSALFIAPFYLDPIDDDLFYLGGANDLYVNSQASSGSSSVGWKTITLTGNINSISELGVSSQGVIYVGTFDGKVFRIQDPGGYLQS